MEKRLLLSLLETNARFEVTDLAAALNETEEAVKSAMKELEAENIIAGYHTLINWDKTNTDAVTALIQISADPVRDYGYELVARKIQQYSEIDSLFLLSGSYEFLCIIKGRTMQEVAQFVNRKLAPIEGVTGTETYFVLKQYKASGIMLNDEDSDVDERLLVSA